ncbi:MAG: hypothetical protein IKM24_05660 [Clostridia bacterium]|nr:hypothetical protein [Clostridia bacterium]
MATRTRNVKPTALLFSTEDRFRNFPLMVDGDLTTNGSLSALSSETILGVLGGFDFSWLSDDATVTGISLYGYGYKGSSSSSYYGTAALVKDVTSATSNTDLGDGNLTWINSASKKGVTVQFPKALSACTPSFLKSGALAVKLRARGTGIYIYELYLVVTYEVPSSVITVHAGTGGTVSGGGEYENGTTATLTATPNVGYVFKQWSDGNTNATRTITVTANATYTAEFEKVYTSNLFVGTQRVTAYCGTQKMCTYCGTQKI